MKSERVLDVNEEGTRGALARALAQIFTLSAQLQLTVSIEQNSELSVPKRRLIEKSRIVDVVNSERIGHKKHY